MDTDSLHAAIDDLHEYGYCLLPELLPADWCADFARRCLTLHDDPDHARYVVGDAHYQTLFGMMNHDEATWRCAFHEVPVAVARAALGETCRVVEACSKPTWPGAPHQPLHVDSAGRFVEVPDVPWMVNSMWMLTDFTRANGATGVVPFSHRSRRTSPPPELDVDGPLVQTVTARAGSLLMWHGGTFHMARANRGDTVRVGLNVAYYPPWFNNWVENGHQPVWPETYERLPEAAKPLVPGRRGRYRDDLYEAR